MPRSPRQSSSTRIPRPPWLQLQQPPIRFRSLMLPEDVPIFLTVRETITFSGGIQH